MSKADPCLRCGQWGHTSSSCKRPAPPAEHMNLELQGVKLNKAQRDFWRVALRSEILARYGIDTSQKFNLADLGAAINQRRAA